MAQMVEGQRPYKVLVSHELVGVVKNGDHLPGPAISLDQLVTDNPEATENPAAVEILGKRESRRPHRMVRHALKAHNEDGFSPVGLVIPEKRARSTMSHLPGLGLGEFHRDAANAEGLDNLVVIIYGAWGLDDGLLANPFLDLGSQQPRYFMPAETELTSIIPELDAVDLTSVDRVRERLGANTTVLSVPPGTQLRARQR